MSCPTEPMDSIRDGRVADAAPPSPPSSRIPAEEASLPVAEEELNAVFQPVLDLRTGAYMGFEGLIRGPAGSALHTPGALFGLARSLGLTLALERACGRVILHAFARLRLPGKLFLNVSPSSLDDPQLRNETRALLDRLGLSPQAIVIEVTENEHVMNFAELKGALAHYRQQGYQVAIDDLGDGFSNLRLWTELRPEFVKIDRHFIQGISEDNLKLRMVRAIHEIADGCGAVLIAEGIETEADFITVRDLGLAGGQGFFIDPPAASPNTEPPRALRETFSSRHIAVFPNWCFCVNTPTAGTLARMIPPVEPSTSNEAVYQRFESDPGLYLLPVVRDGHPVGLLERYRVIDRFARLYHREIYGKKPCSLFMDPVPLIVDQNMPVHALGRLVSRSPRHPLHNGFIITADGRYLGVGASQDLLALITEMQISAARYANPLTQLPGNVPINEHTDRLLANRAPFVACYFDIDHFKPYNDAYGYRKGDELIQWLAALLMDAVDKRKDFVGHIGGDDFIVLFQSPDWHRRCEQVLRRFDQHVPRVVLAEDRVRGGFRAEDRQGRTVIHPLPSLSVGAVRVEPGMYSSHHEVAAALATAKQQAKRQSGSVLFVERRRPSPAARTAPCPQRNGGEDHTQAARAPAPPKGRADIDDPLLS